MNRKEFYTSLRKSIFKKGLGKKQVAGMEFILDQWGETGFMDTRWLAYALATTLHETARTMQPIKERGGHSYFMRMYDKSGARPHVAKRLGNTVVGDGAKFAGRGFVQLTGRTNYTRASRILGIDFLRSPAKVMEPNNAAFIMFQGMKDGWFTGKGFASYLSGNTTDYVNARRIINGTDKAEKIAGYAEDFERAISAAVSAKPEPRPVPIPTAPTSTNIISLLVAFLKRIFGR